MTNSPYSYTVRAIDGSDSFADIDISIKVDRRPVAGEDTAIVPEGGWVDINVAANDTDADGDDLSVIGVGAGPGSPANGSAVIKDGSTTGVTYISSLRIHRRRLLYLRRFRRTYHRHRNSYG